MSACVHRRLLPVNAAKLYTTSERIEFNIIIVVDKLASQNTRFLVEVRKRQLIQALFVLCNIPVFFCDIFLSHLGRFDSVRLLCDFSRVLSPGRSGLVVSTSARATDWKSPGNTWKKKSEFIQSKSTSVQSG